MLIIHSRKQLSMESIMGKVSNLVFALMIGYNSFGQTPNLVKSDSITYPIHKANIGKIAFMGNILPMESFKESDFLKVFELKEKADFNIRVFLANSLTNYLHFLQTKCFHLVFF